ncbi:MAG TPA: GNAT family N-acetyltransferase [Acetobacteraceae bacterium]|jgi:putative acetyltransferase|nr:GNAT family N-acetyltransferase [Acetobacteraceae bacterium]
MTPDVTYRAVRPADAEAIAAMQSLPGFRFGTLRPPYPSPERIRRRIEGLSERQFVLAASVDGVLVATGDLTTATGRRAHAGSVGMGVHDAWVGQGIGTGLLRELLEIADRWLGLRRVELTVYTDNARAIALYRRHGFEIEGTHRGYALRDGIFADAHTMARHTLPGSG